MADESKIVYRCAGPKVEASEFALHQIINKLLEGKEKGTVILDDDQVARLRETRDAGVPNLFTIGQTFGLGNDGKPFVREDCGADVSGLIESVPADGEVHEVKCSKCGTVATAKRMPAPEEPEDREAVTLSAEDVGKLNLDDLT